LITRFTMAKRPMLLRPLAPGALSTRLGGHRAAPIADEMAMSVANDKTAAVPDHPGSRKASQRRVHFGGLLGEVAVLAAHP
jgi:hypothetical protein